MKKLLSLVLVLSLCLSSVILLASCKGPSAYEVAVENGFTGSETEWLESLKGPAGEAGEEGDAGNAGADGYPGLPGQPGLDPHAYKQFYENYTRTVQEWLASLEGTDGKDGHNVTVTVNENGYWVIDGTRQPVKVTGEPVKVLSIELVNNVFTVVKGNATVPQLEMKVKFDDGSEDVLPVSNSVIANTSYDLTKEGAYPVTLSYGGVTATDTITVEGLMVYYSDFNDLANTSTMADICAATGIRIPTVGPDNTARKGTLEATGEEVVMYGYKTWYDDGSDVSPYVIYGGYHGAHFPSFRVENGKLWYQSMQKNEVFTNTASDSMIVFRTDEEMNYASTDIYTIQMNFKFTPSSDNGTPDDTSDDIKASFSETAGSNNVIIQVKFMDEGVAATSNAHNRPVSIGAAFGAQFLMGNVYRKSSWYLGKGPASSVSAAGVEEYGQNTVNVLTTLFPDSDKTSWLGEEVTVRIVVYPKTAEKPGFTVYIKKAADGEDKFIKVGDYNADTVNETGMTWFMKEENDGFGLQTRSLTKYSGFYIDDIAAWTGAGNMPKNTSTTAYEELNAAYNASLPTETPAA